MFVVKAFSSTDPHIPPTETISMTCHSPPSNAFPILAPDCYVVALLSFSSSLVHPHSAPSLTTGTEVGAALLATTSIGRDVLPCNMAPAASSSLSAVAKQMEQRLLQRCTLEYSTFRGRESGIFRQETEFLFFPLLPWEASK